MKRLPFSLHPLRNLLERQEQIALQDYAKTVLALEQARKKVATLEANLRSGRLEFQRRLADASAAELAKILGRCHDVEDALEDQTILAGRARRSAQQAFTKLLAARKASAVVEKYYEIQKRQQERERRQHEQKILDHLLQSPAAPSPAAPAPAPRESVWN